MTGDKPELFWDATYAIVLALFAHYPERSPEDVGLIELSEMVQALPGFADDPALVTERMLLDIQITWFEETMNL
ncbi:MAG: Fe-S cluster assembly protein IscX [Anaerolineae bacterium]